MTKDTTRIFIGDSMSSGHLTKNLGVVVEKGLTTGHMTSQLRAPESTPAPAAPSQPTTSTSSGSNTR